MHNFDPKKPTELHTDAARTKGLGFVLLQEQKGEKKLVQCGSRFLGDAETRYSMVELELLGVVWAMKKCHIYLSGMKDFKIIVDHKPLESILNKKTLNEVDSPRL